jgi:hypothetical protein
MNAWFKTELIDAVEEPQWILLKDLYAKRQGEAPNRKIIEIAQRDLKSDFDLAKSLDGAENLDELADRYADYLRNRLRALTAQAEEVRALLAKKKALRAQETSVNELRNTSPPADDDKCRKQIEDWYFC